MKDGKRIISKVIMSGSLSILAALVLLGCTIKQNESLMELITVDESVEYCYRGLEKYKDKEYHEAIALYSKAFELDSLNATAIYMRALCKGKYALR